VRLVGTLVYRMAEQPFEFLARTVKCLGMLDPCAFFLVKGDDIFKTPNEH
jgi:hypothetical protein